MNTDEPQARWRRVEPQNMRNTRKGSPPPRWERAGVRRKIARRGYDRMVLVEFKQALKDLATVPTDELPHLQMMRYAEKIAEEKALHLGSRRPIKAKSNARYYFYAVCEFSPALRKRLVQNGFTPSPTGDGAFWVTNEGRYYFEYISLPKLLEDAQARNLAFFRRLGLEA